MTREKQLPLVQSCCPISFQHDAVPPPFLVHHPFACPTSEELPPPIKKYILCNITLVLEGHKQPWFPQLTFGSTERRNTQVSSFRRRQEGEVRSNPSGKCSLGSHCRFESAYEGCSVWVQAACSPESSQQAMMGRLHTTTLQRLLDRCSRAHWELQTLEVPNEQEEIHEPLTSIHAV